MNCVKTCLIQTCFKQVKNEKVKNCKTRYLECQKKIKIKNSPKNNNVMRRYALLFKSEQSMQGKASP